MLSIIQAAGWPIWPLIACSILALALVFERFVALKTARVAPPKLLDEAISVSSKSIPSPDVVNQLAQNSALGEVLASGLRTLNSNPQSTEADVRAAMEGAGRAVAHRLEKYLNALATIASAAPLLGLLGTIIGMVEAFKLVEIYGDEGGATILAGSISKALITTVIGLVIAIPALALYHFFRFRIQEMGKQLDEEMEKLVNAWLLKGPRS